MILVQHFIFMILLKKLGDVNFMVNISLSAYTVIFIEYISIEIILEILLINKHKKT